MSRAHYLSTVEYFRLDQAARIVRDAFGFGFGVYLVGSCLRRPDYRDVDVRCLIGDADFDRLFPDAKLESTWRHPTFALVCAAISSHLAQTTGLPIDFQIQPVSEANRLYGSTEHPRSHLGILTREVGAMPLMAAQHDLAIADLIASAKSTAAGEAPPLPPPLPTNYGATKEQRQGLLARLTQPGSAMVPDHQPTNEALNTDTKEREQR